MAGKTKNYTEDFKKQIVALKQNGVTSVIAETDLDAFASQRILERCGFKNYKQEETIWWRL